MFKELDNDFILAFLLSLICIHARKWSWFVFISKQYVTVRIAWPIQKLYFPVGTRWWMNRLTNLFLMRNNSNVVWVILLIDMYYYLHTPVVFCCEELFCLMRMGCVTHFAINIVRSVFVCNIDHERRYDQVCVD